MTSLPSKELSILALALLTRIAEETAGHALGLQGNFRANRFGTANNCKSHLLSLVWYGIVLVRHLDRYGTMQGKELEGEAEGFLCIRKR